MSKSGSFSEFFSEEEKRNATYAATDGGLDPLTGMLRMHAFQEYGAFFLEEKRTEQRSAAVSYYNIADFKLFNERYGFERGNELICSLARTLSEYFPGHGIARFFGDQFVMLSFADELCPAIENVYMAFRDICQNMEIDLKIGIYEIPEKNCDLLIACDRAKIACDSIKHFRESFYRYYDEELKHFLKRKRHIIENIGRAVQEEYIQVYYQPVMRTMTGAACGMEALVRWRDPEYGLMAPGEFISILEEYHLIHLLDCKVMQLVCRDYREAVDAGNIALPVSFNLSRLDFELCNIFGELENYAEQYQVPREMLHIEITESVLTRNPELIRKEIDKFHEAGYQVWMDDFGSGYSSLNILKDFSFDLLKIDMLFLRDFSEKSRKIIASIVDMAKKIGIRTLAEGIETSEQLDFLRDIGCERAQGYYVGRPRPYLETMGHLKAQGILLEDSEARSYNDALGNVNMLNLGFLEPGLQARFMEQPSDNQTLAIIEFEEEAARLVYTSGAFLAELGRIGISGEEELERLMNSRGTDFYVRLRGFAKRLRISGEAESFDTIMKGRYCTVRARLLGEMDGRQAYLATLTNFTEQALGVKQTRMAEILESLYELYELVVILFPEKDRDFIIYRANGELKLKNRPLSMREFIRCYGTEMIPAEEQERYFEFFEMDTAERRLEEAAEGRLDALFHVNKEDGTRQRFLFTMKKRANTARCEIILCVRGFEGG